MTLLKQLLDDDRAIEGMPIRLVIALIVGVAVLGVMMTMINGIGPIEPGTEMNAQPTGDGTVYTGAESDTTITIKVTGSNGKPVENAQVLIKPGTAQIDGASIYQGETGDQGEVDITIPSGDDVGVDLEGQQYTGALTIDVNPPSNSNYVDDRENAEITVVDGTDPESSDE